MNQAKRTIDLSFGKISIIDFPKTAACFSQFPDGRLLVNRYLTKEDLEKNPGVNSNRLLAELANEGEIIHYQLDVSSERSKLEKFTTAKLLEQNIEEVRAALKQYVQEIAPEGHGIQSGLKSVERLVLMKRAPHRIHNTKGSINMIHGVSHNYRDQGTNNFELYLPRGIKLEMKGARPSVLRQRYECFSGTVELGKRQYDFIVHPNTYGWNNYGPQNLITDPEVFRAHRLSLHRMVGVITREYVALELTRALWREFPFIKDYDMLEGFRFDPIVSIDDEVERWKGGPVRNNN